MSMRVRTTYLAICDYPGCCLGHEFWELTEEHAIETVIDDDEWLCLFTGDNEPRFFCPLHLRYRPDSSPDDSPTVFFRFRQSNNTINLARSKQVLRGYEHTATTAKTGMRGHHTSGSHKRGHEMSAYPSYRIRQQVLNMDAIGYDSNEISRLLDIDKRLVLDIESHRLQQDDHPQQDTEQPTLI